MHCMGSFWVRYLNKSANAVGADDGSGAGGGGGGCGGDGDGGHLYVDLS